MIVPSGSDAFLGNLGNRRYAGLCANEMTAIGDAEYQPISAQASSRSRPEAHSASHVRHAFLEWNIKVFFGDSRGLGWQGQCVWGRKRGREEKSKCWCWCCLAEKPLSLSRDHDDRDGHDLLESTWPSNVLYSKADDPS